MSTQPENSPQPRPVFVHDIVPPGSLNIVGDILDEIRGGHWTRETENFFKALKSSLALQQRLAAGLGEEYSIATDSEYLVALAVNLIARRMCPEIGPLIDKEISSRESISRNRHGFTNGMQLLLLGSGVAAEEIALHGVAGASLSVFRNIEGRLEIDERFERYTARIIGLCVFSEPYLSAILCEFDRLLQSSEPHERVRVLQIASSLFEQVGHSAETMVALRGALNDLSEMNDAEAISILIPFGLIATRDAALQEGFYKIRAHEIFLSGFEERSELYRAVVTDVFCDLLEMKREDLRRELMLAIVTQYTFADRANVSVLDPMIQRIVEEYSDIRPEENYDIRPLLAEVIETHFHHPYIEAAVFNLTRLIEMLCHGDHMHSHILDTDIVTMLEELEIRFDNPIQREQCNVVKQTLKFLQ